MILQNFLLSKAKRELSPQIRHLSKMEGAINQAIKKVTTYIDSIVLEDEGVTTKDYLTKRKFEALETILSYLVQEGYSQVKQEHISKKSGISKPLINYIFNWLIDLGVCQQIKVRRHGKIAPSIYILTLHNNYLKIIEYFKVKWAFVIDICPTFTEQLKKKIFKKKYESSHKDEQENIPAASNGLNVFSLEKEPTKAETNYESKDYKDRLQDFNYYLSEDQQKAYHYIMSQNLTSLSEKDAYTIALRMQPDIDQIARWIFESCVHWFKFNKAENSNPAHFIKMYSKKLKEDTQRRHRKAKEQTTNFIIKQENKLLYYNWLEEDK